MRKFIFKITDEYRLEIVNSRSKQYTADDACVYLYGLNTRVFLYQDSLFYGIVPFFDKVLTMQDGLEEYFTDSSNPLSKRIYEKTKEVWDDDSYDMYTLLSVLDYIILVIAQNEELYIEIAQMHIIDGKKQYDLVLQKTLSKSLSNQWREQYYKMKDFSNKNHNRLFK